MALRWNAGDVTVTRTIEVRFPKEEKVLVIQTGEDGKFLGATFGGERLKVHKGSLEKERMNGRAVAYVSPGTLIVTGNAYCTKYWDPILRRWIYICPPGTQPPC